MVCLFHIVLTKLATIRKAIELNIISPSNPDRFNCIFFVSLTGTKCILLATTKSKLTIKPD